VVTPGGGGSWWWMRGGTGRGPGVGSGDSAVTNRGGDFLVVVARCSQDGVGTEDQHEKPRTGDRRSFMMKKPRTIGRRRSVRKKSWEERNP
jgi:hypothetical protein